MASFLETGPTPRPGAASFGSPFSTFEFRVSILHFRVPQFSNREGRKTNEFLPPTAIYLQHNKGPDAEYFVRPKMAHPIENTGVIDCISFKVCRFNRLTHGCLESSQSESESGHPQIPTSFVSLSAASPESRSSSRVPNHESRVPAVGISDVQFLRSRLQRLDRSWHGLLRF